MKSKRSLASSRKSRSSCTKRPATRMRTRSDYFRRERHAIRWSEQPVCKCMGKDFSFVSFCSLLTVKYTHIRYSHTQYYVLKIFQPAQPSQLLDNRHLQDHDWALSHGCGQNPLYKAKNPRSRNIGGEKKRIFVCR